MHCAQYFVNSSLAPVVLFRRRLKSVADVLKGNKSKGFSQSRSNALLGYWEAVCLMVRVVQPLPFTPGTSEFP